MFEGGGREDVVVFADRGGKCGMKKWKSFDGGRWKAKQFPLSLLPFLLQLLVHVPVSAPSCGQRGWMEGWLVGRGMRNEKRGTNTS